MKVSQSGIGRAATRVLPATVLGVAALTGLGGSLQAVSSVDSADQATPQPPATPPVQVAESAIEAPASLTNVSAKGTGISAKLKVVSAVSTQSIPSPALAAYQRAASVINASDPSCHIDWELIAAIARVESDHGQHGGSSLDAKGVARPAIIGVALDGKGTARIADTDAGQYDNDTTHDRAVGPLQFIPATWSVVGVDADGDGVRNPQDIDDASLAAAVYLCSGSDDLSTAAGRNSAVFRYNHSDAYVSVVLGLMNSYVEGNFAANPTVTPVSASTAVDSRMVGTTPTTTTNSVKQGPATSAWAMLTRDGAKLRPGGVIGFTSEGTFTPTEPESPTDPGSPADPPETDGPKDPKPAEPGEPTTDPEKPGGPTETDGPTEPGSPATCEVDEDVTEPVDGVEPTEGASESPQIPTDESPTDEATADPEEPLVDDPCTPDIDESDPAQNPTGEAPTQTPGEEATPPVS